MVWLCWAKGIWSARVLHRWCGAGWFGYAGQKGYGSCARVPGFSIDGVGLVGLGGKLGVTVLGMHF